MSAPKFSGLVTVVLMTLLSFVAYHPVGLAEPWMSMFMDTGLSDTGAATDDTATPGEPAGDTGTPTDDTATPADPTDDTGALPDAGDDTGSGSESGEPGGPDDTGDTGDTGEAPEVIEGDDTGASGQSAAELAGEKGGCGCSVRAAPATGFVWLSALLLAVVRRR